MKRNEFMKKAATAAIVGLPLVSILTSCYNNAGDPAPITNPTANCLDNGTSSSIATNHGHSLTVSKDDVKNGVEKSYDIQAGASHPHTVTISSSQFNSLKSNTSIEIVSTSNSGHTHTVSVGCA